jgi:hypothetical protein
MESGRLAVLLMKAQRMVTGDESTYVQAFACLYVFFLLFVFCVSIPTLVFPFRYSRRVCVSTNRTAAPGTPPWPGIHSRASNTLLGYI